MLDPVRGSSSPNPFAVSGLQQARAYLLAQIAVIDVKRRALWRQVEALEVSLRVLAPAVQITDGLGAGAMSAPFRKLRWRVLRGLHWLDFIEERREGEPVMFVGMIDGRETLRSSERRTAEVDLIRLGSR